MQDEPWHVKRLRELEAAALKRKRKKKVERFVQVPLWWIETAAKDIQSPETLVLIELLHARWKTKSSTFPLPNGRLKTLGVSRKIKYRVLRDLQRRPVILIERRAGKTPIVTLIGL
jgi:hypothetical protein